MGPWTQTRTSRMGFQAVTSGASLGFVASEAAAAAAATDNTGCAITCLIGWKLIDDQCRVGSDRLTTGSAWVCTACTLFLIVDKVASSEHVSYCITKDTITFCRLCMEKGVFGG